MRGRRASLLARTALVAVALAVASAEPALAAGQSFRVVVVEGLGLADLEALAPTAAVGLLVPGAGPRVSEDAALAALVRGKVRNSLRGGLPSGPVLIDYETAAEWPLEGPAIVLSLPVGGDQPHETRFPIAVLGDGYEGLLTSESTRIPGLVSIVDVAPTALGEDGGLGSVADPDAAGHVEALDARISDNATARPLAALLAGLVILALVAISPAAGLLGFAGALSANLVLGLAGVSEPWLVLAVIGLATGPAAWLASRRLGSPFGLAAVFAAVMLAYLVVLGADGQAVALSPLGPSQNSRFFGLSNLLSALLLVPALAGVALARIALGWGAAGAVAAVSLVAIAGSRFGTDGGTAIVLVAGLAVLTLELARERRRAAFAVAALAAAAVAALVAVDAATGPSSHLTDAIGGGPDGLAADLRDRAVLAWARATEHWWLSGLVAAGTVLIAVLAVRLVLAGMPRARRALPLALASATLVSLVVNDSPLDVTSAGLVGYLAAQAYALAGEAPPSRFAQDG